MKIKIRPTEGSNFGEIRETKHDIINYRNIISVELFWRHHILFAVFTL